MEKIKFEPVEEEEIPRRGKYREEVRQCVSEFLKQSKKNGVKALKSNQFNDHKLAMSYYDSFKDHIKREKLPVVVKIRKNNDGNAWKLFLLKMEG